MSPTEFGPDVLAGILAARVADYPRARLALAMWKRRGCNELADYDDIHSITERINGPALEGLAPRCALLRQAKEIFIDQDIKEGVAS